MCSHYFRIFVKLWAEALLHENLLAVVDVDASGQIVAVNLLTHHVVVAVVTLHVGADLLDRGLVGGHEDQALGPGRSASIAVSLYLYLILGLGSQTLDVVVGVRF